MRGGKYSFEASPLPRRTSCTSSPATYVSASHRRVGRSEKASRQSPEMPLLLSGFGAKRAAGI